MKRIPLTAAASCAALLLAAPAASGAETKTIRYGPIKVDGYEVAQDQVVTPAPRVNGFITAMEADVVDASGAKVPIQRLMLHHVVFSNLGATIGAKRDATCGTFTGLDSKSTIPALAERFYGAGEERAKLALPPGYGYGIGENDTWFMTYMLMNHRAAPDEAFIEYKVTYEPAAAGLTPVKPYWLDVRNCHADPVYDVPGGGKRGSTHRRSADVTVPEGGRIVAAGGHVHGGARDLRLSQPDCGGRELLRSKPAWGVRGHPFYNVRPVLHEPGPINMSGTLSQQGYPVAPGGRLRLTSRYENSRLHTRVMGIMLAYLAPDSGAPACAPLPTDAATVATDEPHRTAPPRFRVPLVGLGADGQAREIRRPAGRVRRVAGGSTIGVGDFDFLPRNVSIAAGARLRWAFRPSTLHNVTVADGPRGFSSDNLNGGRIFDRRLKRPGTYKIYCALHPVDMTSTVTVRRRR